MRAHLLVAVLLAGLVSPAAAAEDVPTRARELARSGHRAEALRILQDRLALRPEDTDARVMYGIVLSWEGRLAESRRELEQVLREKPGHGDATLALAGLELREGHPAEAERLARHARTTRPQQGDFMLVHARALRALGRHQEAFDIADRLTVLQPQNDPARRLRDSLRESLRVWEVKALYRHDGFDDTTEDWQEGELSVRRRTPLGSLIGRVSQARRFGQDGTQVELDFYPSLRDGTYLYLSAGAGDSFFPDARFAADVYQSLGKGFELTAGWRRLQFDEGVDIYTAALGKYYGRWYFTVRGYGRPDSEGDSVSVHLQARRYLGNGLDFVGLRYGTGSSREELLEDVAVLDSDSFAGEAELSVAPAVQLVLRGGYSREERLRRERLGHWNAAAGFSLRF